MSKMPHVVIVGAGFGGLSATRELDRMGYRVTLIDRHPYNTFQPLLYQVATGGLNAGDVTFPLRFFSARHHASFRRATVIGIDQEAQEVVCRNSARVPYDYLIIGTGTTSNHFGIPGAAEYTMSMYTRAEALKVRDTIFGGLETIAGTTDRGTGGFTVVVVGGGPTGVEMAGSLAELRSTTIPVTFPELDISKVKVILVEMAEHLLMPFDQSLRDYTLKELLKRGVDVRLKTALSEVHPDHVDFGDGTSLPVDLVIWAAGVAGHPGVREWGVPVGRGGRIEVDEDTRVKGTTNVFAIGDGSLITDKPVPQLAQPAMQTGKHAARMIDRIEKGQPTFAFQYHDKGTMATIGEGAAVVELVVGKSKPKITGVLAWLSWIGLHIFMLLGGRNRTQTFVNLLVRYAPWRRHQTAIIGDVQPTPAMKGSTKDKAVAS